MKPLSEIGTDAEVSITGKQIRETKTRFTTEQKLSALLRVLSHFGNDVFFTDLARAAIVSADTNSVVYVQVFEEFNLPQFYCGSGVDEVNRDKGVDFEIGPMSRRGDNYDHSDRYFKKKHYHFFTFAGIGKFTRLTGEWMGKSSHEAFLFRAYQGKDVPLGVFGYLKHLTGFEYQIKPFAIWV